MSNQKKEFLLTKIVSTLGPASAKESVVEQLIQEGVRVFRINFSHGTLEEHRENIRRIRSAAAELNRACLILADLPGPKIRIGTVQDDTLMLTKGHSVTLPTEAISGTATRISRRTPDGDV